MCGGVYALLHPRPASDTDTGVARDSIVNQLLTLVDAQMPLPCPTFVIAITNRLNLIEPALLRPGRLEVKVEMTVCETAAERKEIWRMHTRQMEDSGKLVPSGADGITSYDEILNMLAAKSTNATGADIEGHCRAAAAAALGRAVDTCEGDAGRLEELCVVNEADFLLS